MKSYLGRQAPEIPAFLKLWINQVLQIRELTMIRNPFTVVIIVVVFIIGASVLAVRGEPMDAASDPKPFATLRDRGAATIRGLDDFSSESKDWPARLFAQSKLYNGPRKLDTEKAQNKIEYRP